MNTISEPYLDRPFLTFETVGKKIHGVSVQWGLSRLTTVFKSYWIWFNFRRRMVVTASLFPSSDCEFKFGISQANLRIYIYIYSISIKRSN